MNGLLIQKVNVGNLVDCEITGFDEHPVISRNNLLPSESDLKKALLYRGQAKIIIYSYGVFYFILPLHCPNVYIVPVDQLAGRDGNT